MTEESKRIADRLRIVLGAVTTCKADCPAEWICQHGKWGGMCIFKEAADLIEKLSSELEKERLDHQHTRECAEVFEKDFCEWKRRAEAAERDLGFATERSLCGMCVHGRDCDYEDCHFEWRGPCSENGGVPDV